MEPDISFVNRFHSKSESGSFITSSSLPWLIVILLFLAIAIYVIRFEPFLFLIFPSFLAFIILILTLVLRLRKYMKPSTLRKVPSLNYWMPLVEDEEQVIIQS